MWREHTHQDLEDRILNKRVGVSSKVVGRSSNCYKCRVTDHWARECKDCEPTCFKCGLNGHISTRCREPERSQNTTRGGSRGGYGSRGRTGYQGTRRIEDDRSRGSDGEDYNLMRALEEESLRLGNDFNIQLSMMSG